MKRVIKTVILISAAGLVALAGSNLGSEGSCSCHAPIAIFGSLLGCGGPGETNSMEVADTAAKESAGESGTPQGGHLVTFVEIGSVNCIPCRMMQPVMKAVEEQFSGKVKIVFYDVWTPEGKADAMKYNIRIIPTQVFLDSDDKEYFRHEGFFPKDDVFRVLAVKGVK